MALTLEELYARRAQQRQAQRGLLNAPFAPVPQMGGMGGSTMRTVPDMAEPSTVVPSDPPDMEMLDGAMPRPDYRQMMEAQGRGGGMGAPTMPAQPGQPAGAPEPSQEVIDLSLIHI